MSFAVVAKKDFLDAIRSKVFWVISIVFTLLVVGIGAVFAYFDELGGEMTSVQFVEFLFSVGLPIFIPVTAIVVCHRAIAGERETGSLRLLLSLPHTRLDIVVGKVLGRTGVLAVPVVVSIVISILVAAVGGVSIEIVPILVLIGVSVLFVLAYAGLYVGLSALTESTTLVLAIGFAQFILFEIVWGALINVFFIFGLDVDPFNEGFPDYNYILQTIPPSNATERVLNLALETFVGGARVDAGPDVFYATPWLGVVVLALWCLVPLTVGYIRFSTADL